VSFVHVPAYAASRRRDASPPAYEPLRTSVLRWVPSRRLARWRLLPNVGSLGEAVGSTVGPQAAAKLRQLSAVGVRDQAARGLNSLQNHERLLVCDKGLRRSPGSGTFASGSRRRAVAISVGILDGVIAEVPLILWAIVFWIAGAAGLVEVWRTWREGRDDPARRMPTYWPFGEQWWRGYHRGVLPIDLAILALAAAGTFAGAELVFGALALFVFLPLFFTIFLFNRPKLLVPPAARDEHGVISREHPPE
jgi:hypothetical protein